MCVPSTIAGHRYFVKSNGYSLPLLRQQIICIDCSGYSKRYDGAGRRWPLTNLFFCVSHRLNMEVDLQSLFGLHVTWCSQLQSLAVTPQPPPSPRIWTRIKRALLVSRDRRHLFVTPWCISSLSQIPIRFLQENCCLAWRLVGPKGLEVEERARNTSQSWPP